MLLISKVIIGLISPVGSSLILLLLALLLCTLGHRRWALGFGSVAFVWLWAWSLPVASDLLLEKIEAAYPVVPVQELPSAQAIVVLGGAMNAATPAQPLPDLSDASDRVWHASRIYHTGKAPLLVLSGGTDPHATLTSEAGAMRVLLHDLGVPDTAMLLEGRSRNTQENARFTAALLQQRGLQHILLVTSALHMRRAHAYFEATGLEVTPAATDYTNLATSGLLGWLPDAAALECSARGLKEVVGMWVMP